MNRETIRSLVFVIDGLGINVTEETASIKIWRYVCWMIKFTYTNFTFIMYSILHQENFYEIASAIIYMGVSQTTMVGVSAILYNKQKLRRLLGNMDKGIFTYPDEDHIPVKYSWFLDERNNPTVYYIILLGVLFTYSFLFAIAAIQIFFYEQIFMVYPNWSPWKNDGVTSQIISLVFQHLTVLGGLWFYCVVGMFLITTACEFARQVDRLCAAIRSLNDRTKEMTMREGNRRVGFYQDEIQHRQNYHLGEFQFKNRFDSLFRGNIMNCSKHHELILKNYKLFRAVFKIFFSFELACCSVTLSLALFCMIYAPNFKLIISRLVVVLIMVVNFFTRCFIGEQLTHLNKKLKNTIFYESGWHEQNIENMRLLLMFHEQASASFDLKGFLIFPASLSTFAKILRTAYSFFNVLVKSI